MAIWPLDVESRQRTRRVGELIVNSCRQPRRFGPLDALLLAATFAAAIAVSRIDPRTLQDWIGLRYDDEVYYVEPRPDLIAREPGPTGFKAWIESLRSFCRGTLELRTPVLVLVAPGIALATTRGLGPAKRSRRGPGVLTSIISGSMVVVLLTSDYLLRRFSGFLGGYGNNPFESVWREIADQVSVAVLALWIVLAIGQRWHAEPHWRDRHGRALGWAWIVYWFLASVLSPLWLQP
jgi:hypothetical protein